MEQFLFVGKIIASFFIIIDDDIKEANIISNPIYLFLCKIKLCCQLDLGRKIRTHQQNQKEGIDD